MSEQQEKMKALKQTVNRHFGESMYFCRMLSSQNFFTVDIHTHIIPENLPKWKEKFGYGEFVQLEHHKPVARG